MAFITARTPISEINAEIKRNTRAVKNFLPWQLAAYSNSKPKVVNIRQVGEQPIELGHIK